MPLIELYAPTSTGTVVGADGKTYKISNGEVVVPSENKAYLLTLGFQAEPDARFVDTSSTPGNATINAMRGRFSIAAASNTAVITNSFVTANSLVIPVVESADATLVAPRCAPADGYFTFLGNAAATATCNIGFVVIN